MKVVVRKMYIFVFCTEILLWASAPDHKGRNTEKSGAKPQQRYCCINMKVVIYFLVFFIAQHRLQLVLVITEQLKA